MDDDDFAVSGTHLCCVSHNLLNEHVKQQRLARSEKGDEEEEQHSMTVSSCPGGIFWHHTHSGNCEWPLGVDFSVSRKGNESVNRFHSVGFPLAIWASGNVNLRGTPEIRHDRWDNFGAEQRCNSPFLPCCQACPSISARGFTEVSSTRSVLPPKMSTWKPLLELTPRPQEVMWPTICGLP